MKTRALVSSILTPAILALALFAQACARAEPRAARGKVATQANAPRQDASPSRPFEEYMRADFAPADGFDFPFGGGIGFHGRAREWEDSGPRRLSWGCVVLHPKDIKAFYTRLPEGAMVVIF